MVNSNSHPVHRFCGQVTGYNITLTDRNSRPNEQVTNRVIPDQHSHFLAAVDNRYGIISGYGDIINTVLRLGCIVFVRICLQTNLIECHSRIRCVGRMYDHLIAVCNHKCILGKYVGTEHGYQKWQWNHQRAKIEQKASSSDCKHRKTLHERTSFRNPDTRLEHLHRYQIVTIRYIHLSLAVSIITNIL